MLIFLKTEKSNHKILLQIKDDLHLNFKFQLRAKSPTWFWILLRKRQINWEISSNFCSPLRKPELYSRSYGKNQNLFSLKLLKLIGLCTVRQISIIQAFTDSNWQPPKCYRMSKIFFVPVPIWSSSCNPSDTIFRILPHAKKK